MFNKKTLREIIIESSVIISSILIFFGFLKQYWFYDHFGLKIHQYLSFDEVLILFFGELPFILKLVFYTMAYFLALNVIFKVYCYFKDKKAKKSKEEKLIDTESEINNSLEEYVNNRDNYRFLFFLSLVLNIVCVLLFNFFPSEVTIIYLAIMSSQTLMVTLDLLDIKLDKILGDSIAIIVYLSIMLYCKNEIDINHTLNQYHENEYSITLKNEIISTNKNVIFLGKTKGYLFLFTKSINNTRIIKNEDVIEINIKTVINCKPFN